jgi:predicted ATP-grasp superfamily ATP-dependent carboligase
MPPPHLTIQSPPRLKDATMLLALSGWMDGGLVSTGTVRRLMELRDVREIARIDPDPFYIYNFPGSMEIAALFRPEAKYVDGLITELKLPTNVFHCDPAANLVFFIGQEPNLRWQAFADCVFAVAQETGVSRIVFVGSFGGRVPHTRDPRLYGSVSHERLKPLLADNGVRLSDYEGPAGFSTLLLAQAPERGLEMLSLVAEIPGYLQGLNPLSIEAVTRRLSGLLNQPVDLDSLRSASNEWEAQVTEAVGNDEELRATVRKLEEQYDNELIGAPSHDEEEETEDQEQADEEE